MQLRIEAIARRRASAVQDAMLGGRETESVRSPTYPDTPDGRYFVVRGRLCRRSNPSLSEAERTRLVSELMRGRLAVRLAHRDGDPAAMIRARKAVNEAKVALGERGPVWWSDGQPYLNRHMARTTAYAEWFASLEKLPE